MMFLVVVTMMFVVTTNSIKYRLHTKIIPQEMYKGTKIDACGLVLTYHLKLTFAMISSYALKKLTRRQFSYTCCAWAGGTFFPVVPLCQFFSCGGK
jgi:hypothetical protein